MSTKAARQPTHEGGGMETTTFIASYHEVRRCVIVEVWSRPEQKGGALLGVLLPGADGFRFVSKYLTEAVTVAIAQQEPPALHVLLDHRELPQ